MSDAIPSDPALAGTPEAVMAALPEVRWWKPWIWIPIKLGFGAILMQTPAGAVVVAGWLQRFLQRAIYLSWWRRGRGRLGTFDEFVAEEPMLLSYRQFPNWVMAQERGIRIVMEEGVGSVRRGRTDVAGGGIDVEADGDAGLPGETLVTADPALEAVPATGTPGVTVVRAGPMQRYFGSLASNVWVGIQTCTNVAVLTLPGAALWAAGWWGGWQNSFHKGYEQFMVGPLVSWLGILLFIAAMFYVPMAMARQAATGHWKSFWDGRTVWSLVRVSWWQSAWVAGGYAVANLLVMGLKSWPQFLPQAMIAVLEKRGLDATEAFQQGTETVDWSDLTDAQAVHYLNWFYLGSALVVLLVLLVLRRWVAWLYAGAVLRGVQRGVLGEERLSDTEWRLLKSLGLLQVREAPVRHFLVRFVAWAGTTTGRAVCRTFIFLAWLAFVVAIYVSEFFSYHPVVGWLNQPLVQLPWFRYVPTHLEDPAPALLCGGALILVACLAAKLRRWARTRRGLSNVG